MTADLELFERDVDLRKTGKSATILTHGQPVHSDDLVAIEMIVREAGEKWVKSHLSGGKILLDMPGSEFYDKKPYEYNGRKKKSTSRLVAESLGINPFGRWQKVLAHVDRDDLEGSPDKTDIDTLYKRAQMQTYDPEKLDQVTEWFMQALSVKLDLAEDDPEKGNFTYPHIFGLMKRHQAEVKAAGVNPGKWCLFARHIAAKHQDMYDEAKAELETLYGQGAIISRTVVHQGKALRLAAFESDNYRAAAVMRSRAAPEHLLAQVVIQKSRTGVLIAPDHNYNVAVDEIAAVLRYAEYRHRNRNFRKKFISKTLRKWGTMKGANEWFFNPQLDQIYNSLAHGSPSTKLDLRELMECVVTALADNCFHPHPKIFAMCRAGNCWAAAAKVICPNLLMGLPRCVKIFKAQKERRKRLGLE